MSGTLWKHTYLNTWMPRQYNRLVGSLKWWPFFNLAYETKTELKWFLTFNLLAVSSHFLTIIVVLKALLWPDAKGKTGISFAATASSPKSATRNYLLEDKIFIGCDILGRFDMHGNLHCSVTSKYALGVMPTKKKQLKPLKQWQAVTIHSSSMSEPPHTCKPSRNNATCQGQAPSILTFPPTIRLCLVWSFCPSRNVAGDFFAQKFPDESINRLVKRWHLMKFNQKR